jgi:tRNA (guanine37-N1)-methyltransferase
MRIDVLTLFPEMFTGVLDYSIIGRAKERALVDIRLHNIRSYTEDVHHTADDYPYGGGAGMVMKPEPIFKAAADVIGEAKGVSVILLTPRGRLLNQKIVDELSRQERLVLICGHYEGVDERVSDNLATDQISIGDYVLSGGEIAAMVIIDSIVRLVPGALGSDESAAADSHSDGLLEYPQYTRPPEFNGWEVPPVLLSGNHARIAEWRRQQSLLRTAKYRPDLLDKAKLEKHDKIYLAKMGYYI